jgi:SAM-dependent methyltransferase
MKYPGTELQLFAAAVNWKRYSLGPLRRFLTGDVLEVGAGPGNNTPFLISDAARSWLCLEPDADLAREIAGQVAAGRLPPKVSVRVGTTQDLPERSAHDAILYVDVLEHIADHRAELERAVRLLRPNGHLIVLAPAHQWLYSPFDEAIGHFRRYSRRELAALAPAELKLQQAYCLDSVGLLLSLGNRFVSRQARPQQSQILFWDRWVVPASKLLDPLLGHALGKTVVACWRKGPSALDAHP